MQNQSYPLQPLPQGKPGFLITALSVVSSGVRTVTNQIEPYTTWWDAQNRENYLTDGPLLVIIGDSSALSIGASTPSKGYVPHVQSFLTKRNSQPWRVVNLAKSGAKLDDALDRQLDELAKLHDVSLVICCVGSNDIFWSLSTVSLQRKIKELVNKLPEESLVGALAGGSPRAKASNVVLRKAAEQRGLPFVKPWNRPGPSGTARLAADKFHPNDIGYKLMAEAFTEALET